MTENNSEWSRRLKTLTEASGGSPSGKLYDSKEGSVALTDFGETSYEILDDGQLIVTFVDIGLMINYEVDGQLGFISAEIGKYLKKIPDRVLQKMSDQGEEVARFAQYLEKTNGYAFVTALPKLRIMEFRIRDLKGETKFLDDMEDVNFFVGCGGEFEVDKLTISYYLEESADEFILALGKGHVVSGMFVSNNVDYEKEMKDPSPQKYQNLARKIILNG
jgi:hypothetical protein